MIRNSKQRAYLKSLAMDMTPILQIGKGGVSPDFINSVSQALEARELIKISVLKSCDDDVKELVQTVSERTHSEVVQSIGRKIVLYKEGKEDKRRIILP